MRDMKCFDYQTLNVVKWPNKHSFSLNFFFTKSRFIHYLKMRVVVHCNTKKKTFSNDFQYKFGSEFPPRIKIWICCLLKDIPDNNHTFPHNIKMIENFSFNIYLLFTTIESYENSVKLLYIPKMVFYGKFYYHSLVWTKILFIPWTFSCGFALSTLCVLSCLMGYVPTSMYFNVEYIRVTFLCHKVISNGNGVLCGTPMSSLILRANPTSHDDIKFGRKKIF